jgi:CheY-like chemotaxis protein
MDAAGPADADASRLLAQRLESIATLTAGVAHDLMNTLASVHMGLDLLRPGTPESERWIVSALEENVRRGMEALRQIQWLAACTEGEPLIYQPVHLLKEVQKLMHRDFPPLEVVTDYPEEVCLLSGDPLLLRQLLIALCLHARSRLPLGGSLTLRARSVVLDETYAAQRSGALLGTHLRIDVESRLVRPLAGVRAPGDGGGEFPPALLAALDRQGGFFEVGPPDAPDATGAQTASLRAYLPAAVLAPGSAPGVVATSPEDRGRGERVLVVEPQPTLRALLAAALERSGYRSLAAADGAGGLALLAAAEPPVAVALCAAETVLREGTGVLRAFGTIRSGVPVLVTGPPAALAGLVIPPLGDPAGRIAALPAPFTAAELAHALRAVLCVAVDRGAGA